MAENNIEEWKDPFVKMGEVETDIVRLDTAWSKYLMGRIISKAIEKKLGRKCKFQLKDFTIKSKNGNVHMDVSASADITADDITKLVLDALGGEL